MGDRRVRLVLERRDGEEHEVETGVPQGPPVAPILFTAYFSGVFNVEMCPGCGRRGVVGGREVGERDGKEAEHTAATLDWAREHGVAFDKAKTEAMFLSKRRKNPRKRCGLRSPVQQTRHPVARSLDPLPDDPQGAPCREDEEGPQRGAVHPSSDGAARIVPGRLQEGAYKPEIVALLRVRRVCLS